MANTMIKLQTVTVGASGASSIEFTSIPQTFTDLQLYISSRTTGTNGTIVWKFNTDSTASNYFMRYLAGNGSVASSSNSNNPWFSDSPISTDTTSVFGSTNVYIPNYTGSNSKSLSVETVTENNATLAYQQMFAGRWTGTAAITAITLTPFSGSYAQYTTATLYGIKSS